MIACTVYESPLGPIVLEADQVGLRRVYFGDLVSGDQLAETSVAQPQLSPILAQALAWLRAYFSGEALPPLPPLAPKGTPFQKKVWQALAAIPHGQTVSYGQLAQQINCRSAQAIGQAVGKNPLLLVIPCHRVLGSQGQLTGYAAGIDKKAWLLAHESRQIRERKS